MNPEKISWINHVVRMCNKSTEELPKVTVVTITYNLIKNGRKEYFKQCVNSVYNQTYKNIEHVIIDGASDDGTLELIKEVAPKSRVYSEPDKGIYDAFNKGIKKSQGEYVAFLNSDDYYADEYSIEESVKSLLASDADFSYSKCDFIDEKNECKNIFYPIIELFFVRFPFCHQTMITKKESLLNVGMFDLKYKSASDYDLIIKLLLSGATCVEVQKTVAKFRYGGTSLTNEKLSQDECRAIMKKYFGEILIKEDSVDNYMKNLYVPKKIVEKIENSKIDRALMNKIISFFNNNANNYGKFYLINELCYFRNSAKKIKLLYLPLFMLKKEEGNKGLYLFNRLKIMDIEDSLYKTNFKVFGINIISIRNRLFEKSFYIFNIPIFKVYG